MSLKFNLVERYVGDKRSQCLASKAVSWKPAFSEDGIMLLFQTLCYLPNALLRIDIKRLLWKKTCRCLMKIIEIEA